MMKKTIISQIARHAGRGHIAVRNLSFFDAANRDWEKAWQMNITPWDLKGTVCPALVDGVQQGKIKTEGQRALIPGCGAGYECVFLKNAGFQHVVGLDLSQTAVDVAKKHASEAGIKGIDYEVADFFNYKVQPFDFIFDYLFFAALDPPLRTQWADSMARLVQPETGILATLIFPVCQPNDDPTKGPPYPVKLEDYEQLLMDRKFKLIEVNKVSKT